MTNKLAQLPVAEEAAFLWLESLGSKAPPIELSQFLALKATPDAPTVLQRIKDAAVQSLVSKKRQDLLRSHLKGQHNSPEGATASEDDDDEDESNATLIDAVPIMSNLGLRFMDLADKLKTNDCADAIRAIPYHVSWLYERIQAEQDLPTTFTHTQAYKRKELDGYARNLEQWPQETVVALRWYRDCMSLYLATPETDTEKEVEHDFADVEGDAKSDLADNIRANHGEGSPGQVPSWLITPMGYSQDDVVHAQDAQNVDNVPL